MWTFFTSDRTDIEEWKSHMHEAEMEIDRMEKQIDALSDESWKERIRQILRELSVLKIFTFKLGSIVPMSYANAVRHTLEYKPSPLKASQGHYASLGDFKQLSATQAAQLSDLHDGLKQRKNLVPLLRSAIIRDKILQIYQGVKNDLLREVLGTKKPEDSKQSVAMVEHVENRPDIQQQMGMIHIEPENARKESDILPVRKEGGQIHDLETEDADGDTLDWSEIEKLNEDLNSLLKDRDHRKGQLHELYTVELQAVVENLARHTAVLSVLDREIPGFEVFQSTPDWHESTITDHVTGVLGASAVSAVGQDEAGKQTETSNRKEQRLYISRSTASQSDNTNDGAEHRHSKAPVLMNQLRQYQEGLLAEKHLCAITMKIREDERQLMELNASNDCLEKDYGSRVHVVGLTRRPLLVSCPTLHLDGARVNTGWCHVTTDGQLVNSPPKTRDVGRNRLQEYWGTCSSPIPLPPSSSILTPLPTTPRYWETETRVRVGASVMFLPALEMGLTEAGQVDSDVYVSAQCRSWCVGVWSCGLHLGSLCTMVWRDGERGECHQNTMSNTDGTQATLHYGVVLDVGRGRAAFIDLDRQVVLVKYDETFREPLVPMFSAGSPYPGFTTSMSLISGEDINMTDTKEALIYQALK